MYFLLVGTVIFFSVHLYSSFRSRTPGHDIRERLGYMRFMGVYSLISGFGFALMLWGFGLARPSAGIFAAPQWGRHVAMALMLPSFILLMAAYGPRGHIKQFVKHPMLLSIMLWSLGHLFANGELNSIILFGSFLVYAIIDRLAVSSRFTPALKVSIVGDLYAIIVGAGLYYLFIKYLHELMIGVNITTNIP